MSILAICSKDAPPANFKQLTSKSHDFGMSSRSLMQ